MALMGCSFATNGPPRGYDGRVAPDCTTSQALPVLDTSAAILAGVIGLPLVLAKEDSCDPSQDCHDPGVGIAHGFGALVLTVGAFYVLAAYVGFSRVGECKAALAKHQAMPR